MTRRNVDRPPVSCNRPRLSPRPRPRRPGRLRQKPRQPATKAIARPQGLAKSGEVQHAAGPSSAGSSTNTIRAVGVDWTKPRSVNYKAPCGPEANADFRAAIRQRVQKFADISPAFESTARRREAKAHAAEEAGELVSRASELFHGGRALRRPQWPFDENTRRTSRSTIASASATRSTPSSLIIASRRRGFRSRARHCRAGSILRTVTRAGRIPAVWTIPGMDGFKEANVPCTATGFRHAQIGGCSRSKARASTKSAVLFFRVERCRPWMAAAARDGLARGADPRSIRTDRHRRLELGSHLRHARRRPTKAAAYRGGSASRHVPGGRLPHIFEGRRAFKNAVFMYMWDSTDEARFERIQTDASPWPGWPRDPRRPPTHSYESHGRGRTELSHSAQPSAC